MKFLYLKDKFEQQTLMRFVQFTKQEICKKTFITLYQVTPQLYYSAMPNFSPRLHYIATNQPNKISYKKSNSLLRFLLIRCSLSLSSPSLSELVFTYNWYVNIILLGFIWKKSILSFPYKISIIIMLFHTSKSILK